MPLLHDILINSSSTSGFGITGTANSVQASSTTSHNVSLPTNIASGDLLIAIIGADADRTYTWPAGWTELADELNGTISSATIGYRVATGSEGSTITVTSSTATITAHICLKISGAWITPTASAVSVGTSDPGSHTSAGSRDKLWIATVGGRLNSSITSIGYPTGYAEARQASVISGTGAFAVAASKISSNTTEDPSTFTVSTSGAGPDELAWTLVC